MGPGDALKEYEVGESGGGGLGLIAECLASPMTDCGSHGDSKCLSTEKRGNKSPWNFRGGSGEEWGENEKKNGRGRS